MKAKEMMKKLMTMAMVCCAALAAQAEAFPRGEGLGTASWAVEMTQDKKPYAPESKGTKTGEWYTDMTVYMLDAALVDAEASDGDGRRYLEDKLNAGDLFVLTDEGFYVAHTNGVNSGMITGWKMKEGGKELPIQGNLFGVFCEVYLVYLAGTAPAMFTVATAKVGVNFFDENPCALVRRHERHVPDRRRCAMCGQRPPRPLRRREAYGSRCRGPCAQAPETAAGVM